MKRGMFQLKVPRLDLGIFLVHPQHATHFFRFRGLNGFGFRVGVGVGGGGGGGGGGGCSSCMEGSTSFQWCASISAIYLLILNRIGRRSATQTTLLVFYLFIAFPSALFKILRGQFGCWVAFLAILANLFFPQTFPFSRFTLFIITPNTVANGLRDDIAGGIFCLIIGIITFVIEIWETGGIASCRYSGHCFGYYFGIVLLLLFAILYVCLGNW